MAAFLSVAGQRYSPPGNHIKPGFNFMKSLNRRTLFKTLLGLPLLALASPAKAWVKKPEPQDYLLSHGATSNGRTTSYTITYFCCRDGMNHTEVFQTFHDGWSVTNSAWIGS